MTAALIAATTIATDGGVLRRGDRRRVRYCGGRARLPLAGLTAAGAAGLVAAPALALTPLIPAVAFRLARLPLPPVPASAEDLRDDAFIAGRGWTCCAGRGPRTSS